VIPAAAFVIAPAPPPIPPKEGVLEEVFVFPVALPPLALGVVATRGPWVEEDEGVTIAPLELRKIGGFNPVTKPEADFA
jgi:hypothetical protein